MTKVGGADVIDSGGTPGLVGDRSETSSGQLTGDIGTALYVAPELKNTCNYYYYYFNLKKKNYFQTLKSSFNSIIFKI